ncbi:dynein regulatory complex subunit 2-like [Conger conger]|uniref:dynein regulatory complex subunit 2-like n=1 Tax=Conger conger TaxID=82655 RepID=UPI002A5AFA45|nr:dynein regulatory complex subunit 2-like [Conger conger]
MTEEKWLLHVEQKFKAEDKMAKQTPKMMAEVIADEIQKEEQNSAVNEYNLTAKWRAILRQTKTQELHRDIDVLRQTFERTMDHMDNLIKTLVDDISEATQQLNQLVHTNKQNVEQLLDLQKDRLTSLRQAFSSEVDDLRTKHNTKREQIMTQHQQDLTSPQDVIYSLNESHSEWQSEAQQDYKAACYNIKDWRKRLRSAEQMQHWEKLTKTWRQGKNAEKRYRENTDDNRTTCETLQAHAERCSVEVNDLAKKIKMLKSQEAFQARMKKQDKQEHKDNVAAMQVFVKEKKQKCVEQNSQLRRYQAKREAKLKNMVMQKHHGFTKLQGIVEKGKKLIRLTEVCRKLETESEREQPFYRSTVSSEEQSLVMADQEGTSESAQLTEDYMGLEGLWDRCSKVQLENGCLQRYKKELAQENLRLQTLRSQNKAAVNDDVRPQSRSQITGNRVTLCQRPSPGQQATRRLPR